MTTRYGSIARAEGVAVDGAASRQQWLHIRPFHLLWGLVFLALFAPPLVPGTSIRLDSLAIFFLLPALILREGKLRYDRRFRPVVLAFTVLLAGVALPLFLQLLLLEGSFHSRYLINVQGYLRPLLFALLAAVAIRTDTDSRSAATLLLWGMIFHGVVAVVEYSQLQPLVGYINIWFRGAADHSLGGMRAIGAFNRVHGLAFFSLYALLFSVCIAIQSARGSRMHYLANAAGLLSVVGLTISFSRAAWIAAAACLGFLLLRAIHVKVLVKGIVSLAALAVTVMYLRPDMWARAVGYYSSIVAGFFYFVDPSRILDASEVRFITGRLDWGWRHALESWRQSPVFGDLRAGLTMFVGDGGYTERLVHYGLIGLVSQLIMFSILWVGISGPSVNGRVKAIKNTYLRVFVVGFLFASLATDILKERTIELLPVLLVVLIMYPTTYDRKLDSATSALRGAPANGSGPQ